MRGFGVTGVDFALEVQMDKLAHLVGIDPMEFRILNAYRDGDMKAHRREAKNCALIECVQVAAEKAKWPIREEFRRMSSRTGATKRADAAPPQATRPPPQRTSYERPPLPPLPPQPAPVPPPAPSMAPVPPPPAPPSPTPSQHGVTRYSSVFGTRRR